MSLLTFPLDATEYSASALGAWFATRTRGVLAEEGHYDITTNGGMIVTVGPGIAWLKMTEHWGVVVRNGAPVVLQVPAADNARPRVDAVCLQLDKVANESRLVVKPGAPAVTPSPLPPVRDSNVDEIYLALITVPAGAVAVQASNVADKRLDEFYCGLVLDGTSVPTQGLHDAFMDWFTELQGTLSGDVAGNLLNQIKERIPISDFASEEEAREGIATDKVMSPTRVKQRIRAEGGYIKSHGRFFEAEIRTDFTALGFSPGMAGRGYMFRAAGANGPSGLLSRTIVGCSPSGRFLLARLHGARGNSPAGHHAIFNRVTRALLWSSQDSHSEWGVAIANDFCDFGEEIMRPGEPELVFSALGGLQGGNFIRNLETNQGVTSTNSFGAARSLGIRGSFLYIISSFDATGGGSRVITRYNWTNNTVVNSFRTITLPAGANVIFGGTRGFLFGLNLSGTVFSLFRIDAETGVTNTFPQVSYVGPTTPMPVILFFDKKTETVVWQHRTAASANTVRLWEFNFPTENLRLIRESFNFQNATNLSYQGHIRGTNHVFLTNGVEGWLGTVSDSAEWTFVRRTLPAAITRTSVVPYYIGPRHIFGPNATQLYDLIENHFVDIFWNLYNAGMTPTRPGYMNTSSHLFPLSFQATEEETPLIFLSDLGNQGAGFAEISTGHLIAIDKVGSVNL